MLGAQRALEVLKARSRAAGVYLERVKKVTSISKWVRAPD